MSAFTRRQAAIAVLGGSLLPSASRAQDAAYPTQPIRLVCPGPAGGQTDLAARVLGQGLAERLKTPVVVDNRPGASGMIAGAAVAAAKGDGHTLLLGNTASVSIAPHLYVKGPRYDPQRDLRAVALSAITPLVVVVAASSPYQALADIIRAARERPGALNAGSGGNGTPPHLAIQWLQRTTGVSMTHVPFNGGPPMMAAMLGGHVDFAVEGISGVLPLQGTKIRSLAVTGQQRSDRLPNVPTLKEVLHADAELSGWTGLLAPSSTPDGIVAILADACRSTMKSADMQAFLTRWSLTSEDWTPAEFSAFLSRSARQWSALAAETGLKLD